MRWSKSCLFVGINTLIVLVLAGLTACSGTSATTTTTETTPTVSSPLTPSSPPRGAFSDNRTPPSMDWATAAAELGVTEENLRQSLENSGQGMFDLAQASATLGVTEDELREALGFSEGGPDRPGNGLRPSGTPPTDLPPFTPPGESGETTS